MINYNAGDVLRFHSDISLTLIVLAYEPMELQWAVLIENIVQPADEHILRKYWTKVR